MVGARDPAGREEFRLYLDAAILIPGPQTDRMAEAAAVHGCYLVIGVIEREPGTCYCTVVFFGPDGRLLGKHRKLMPTAMERMIWGFGDGSTLTVVELFQAKIKRRFKADVQIYSPYTYDAVYVIADALKRAGSTQPDALIRAIKATNMEGVTGPIRFDANGDLVKGAVSFFRVRNGRLEYIETLR